MLTSKTISIWLCCLLVFLAGCDAPKLTPVSHDQVIVAFGDSLTQGVGTSSENSYPNVLSRLSGVRVINAGISGETTAEGLARLPGVIREHDPTLIILIEGGNDILRNVSPVQIKQNLEQMINIALASQVQVVLVGVPEKNLFSRSAPFYQELADRYDLVYEHNLIGNLMRSPAKKSDPIHFNKTGYAEMAKGIYELLSENGAFE